MPFVPRMIVILVLIFVIAGELSGQETKPAAETPARTSATAPTETATSTEMTTPEPEEAGATAREVREAFTRLLGQHPPQLTRLLATDPTLLNNDPFLARYPEVAEFVTRHPELRRNPHYYLAEYEVPIQSRPQPFEEAVETLSILSVFVFIAFVLAWAVRTFIEQKRWNRLSARQAEIHNRILDRFATSEELLAYIKTPAGTKFLESAPIPVHAEKSPQSPPSRVMRSIQIGIIVAAGALGMLLVSLRFSGEASYGFFAMGVIGFCIGSGFIGSALISVMLARRLGLWERADPAPGSNMDDPGVMR